MKNYRLTILLLAVVGGILLVPKVIWAASCINYVGEINTSCELTAQSHDPEFDRIHYLFNWDDGTEEWVPSLTGHLPPGVSCNPYSDGQSTVLSDTPCTAEHLWSDSGNFEVVVFAYDEANHVMLSGGEPDGTHVSVIITSRDLSATLIPIPPSPSTAGWYSATTFIYTASCQASSGETLQSCVLEVSNNGTDWAVDPASENDPDNDCDQNKTICSYDGEYIYPTEAIPYYFLVTATDSGTPPNNVISSASVPATNTIGINPDWEKPNVFVISVTNQSSAGPITVTAPFVNWLDNPNYGNNVGHSGVTEWDLRYKKVGNGGWTKCRNNIPFSMTSIRFGSGDITTDCSPNMITLEPNNSYCFQARGRDGAMPTNEELWDNGDTNGDSCTGYMLSTPPVTPHHPTPADTLSNIVSYTQQFSWYGGDPDIGDNLTYSLYISKPDQNININDPADYDDQISRPCVPADPPNDPPGSGDCPVTYGALKKPTHSLESGKTYQWQVKSDDGVSEPVLSDVWNFKVNSPPSVDRVQISPNPVNKSATITWDVTDSDNPAQTLTFDIDYGPQSTQIEGMPVVSGLTMAQANCSAARAPNFTYSCSYYDDTYWPCTHDGSNLYVRVKAIDEIGDTGSKESDESFTINHTEHFTVSGSYKYGDPPPAPFTIEVGTIDNSTITIDAPGTCTEVRAVANAGNEVNCGYGTCTKELNGLTRSTNSMSFVVTDDSCEITYDINYDLKTACNKPYVSAEAGSIYSQGSIKAQYAPTSGYNASYLILGGGSGGSGNEIIIKNFVSKTTQDPHNPNLPINPNFGKLNYPGLSETSSPRVSSFDYYGLTHNLNGKVVDDNEKNSYGHVVELPATATSADGSFDLRNDVFAGASHAILEGKVYWVKGNLTVNDVFTFNNGSSSDNKSGAGLIIVDGDLKINSNFKYPDSTPSDISTRNLASIGWLVRGNVEIKYDVTDVVGTFFVSGTQTTGGTFSTGAGDSQLNVYGSVIAKKFEFQRPSSNGIEPSERIIADGRLTLNTPPGFADIISTLPTWRFSTPELSTP